MTQLMASGIGVEFGATTLLRDVTFTVSRGERWGIIGRNGTGKTTLVRILAGLDEPTRGSIARAAGTRIAMLEQHRDFGGATTVWEAAAGPFAELLALERSLEEQTQAMATAGDAVTDQMLARYDRDLERFGREGGYEIAPRVDAILHGLGFDPQVARTRALTGLSGGERGRVGLARQLVAPADVLILDEPTNHLDLDTTRWLEQWLRESDATVLLISHDRAFLESVADHILHVEAGTATPYVGGFSAFVAQRAERRLTQQRAYEQQRRTIAKEEDYIRRNIAGQNSRQAKGRRTRLERLPRLSALPSDEDAMALRLETSARGGDQVVVADGVRLTVPASHGDGGGGERVLIERFTGRVMRGDVVGFIGPNGAGKSTLLRCIVGDRDPQGGELRVGGSITPAWYRQDLTQVPADRALFDIIDDLRPQWSRGQVLGHLARFGFTGDEVQRTTRTLSGGERARVALAMIMLSRANLLILDEPTNHLDVESIEALEDALEGYEGTVMLVSHDRALLRALASRVWVLHDRHITDYHGTFAEWEVASVERAHAAAVAAAEEEELRRVREVKRTRRADDDRRRGDEDDRRARRETKSAEEEVERLDARVSELTAQLEDPELYATADGVRRAAELGEMLERAKEALEAALERWEELEGARG